MNYTNESVVYAAKRGRTHRSSTGNMSTENRRGTRFSGPTGAMSRAWARTYTKRVNAGAVEQVIYSYRTPIAWLDADYGWIVPVETYSITTSSKHQSHLYLLGGRRVVLAWDATEEDAQRVLDGLMVFTTDTRGHVTGIRAA